MKKQEKRKTTKPFFSKIWGGFTVPAFSILTVVSLITLGTLNIKGWESLQEIQKVPETENQWQTISAKNTPGMDWARTFVSENPGSIADWGVSSDSSPNNFTWMDNCSDKVSLSNALQGLWKGSGKNNVSVEIQVYSAGQASAKFKDYSNVVQNCESAGEFNIGGSQIFSSKNVQIFSLGDAIISVSDSDGKTSKKLLDSIVSRVKASLISSGCKNIISTESDSNRNPYYDSKDFTGLIEIHKLTTNVDVAQLPKGKISILSSPNYREEPESPLPSTLSKMPKTMARPDIPVEPDSAPIFQARVSYRIADNDGPGCGWIWSGQSSPPVNLELLDSTRNQKITQGQSDLDKKAASWIDDRLVWALNFMEKMPDIDSWNLYVKKVNKVYKEWQKLEEARTKLEPIWLSYVEKYNYWSSFDETKDAAQKKYDDAVTKCEAKQTAWDEWYKKYHGKNSVTKPAESPSPTPSPTPTPTVTPSPTASPTPTPTETIPPEPDRCSSDPVPDPILKLKKPAKPAKPVIPDSVTIPDSWPKPE